MDLYLDQHELKYVIGRTDFFIGSRLHACIAALSQGIPTIGIAYSQKFVDVFGSLGCSDFVIDGRCVTEEQAIDTIVHRLKIRVELHSRIQTRLRAAVNKIDTTFHNMSQKIS